VTKILALREKFTHMSTISGYDALYHHFPDDIHIDSIFCNFKKAYPRGIGRLLATASKFASSSGFYNAQSFEVESRIAAKSLGGRYDVIHYAYGEPYFGLGSILKKVIKSAIIITNHQPVSWWQNHEVLFKKYNAASKVITLSEYDKEYFNSKNPGQAVCIPHGVDIDFYKPASVKKTGNEQFKIIFTGRYLRDMTTLASVIKKLSGSYKHFYFDVVYLNKKDIWQPFLIEIMNLPNVNWHADVSDRELLNLYQQADCLLIPLEDCTANNAILEAMACGLPVVSTDLPAIKTYLDDSMSILGRKGNADDLSDTLIALNNDRAKRDTMAVNAHRKAVKYFDWNIIANHTASLFETYNR
jgi:glycosyltransferase involved in cell wall biosynthesis